jgi:hypothetical protein
MIFSCAKTMMPLNNYLKNLCTPSVFLVFVLYNLIKLYLFRVKKD